MATTTLINLTPHTIRIRLEASNEPEPLDTDVVIPPAGPAANIRESDETLEGIDVYFEHPSVGSGIVTIPTMQTTLGEITNLPEPQEGVVFIVSIPVAQYAASQLGRSDCAAPNTSRGHMIKAPSGGPYAVRGLRFF